MRGLKATISFKPPDKWPRELGMECLRYWCTVVMRVQDVGSMGLLHEVTNIEDGLDRRPLEDFQLGLSHGVPDVIKVHVIPEKGQQDRGLNAGRLPLLPGLFIRL